MPFSIKAFKPDTDEPADGHPYDGFRNMAVARPAPGAGAGVDSTATAAASPKPQAAASAKPPASAAAAATDSKVAPTTADDDEDEDEDRVLPDPAKDKILGRPLDVMRLKKRVGRFIERTEVPEEENYPKAAGAPSGPFDFVPVFLNLDEGTLCFVGKRQREVKAAAKPIIYSPHPHTQYKVLKGALIYLDALNRYLDYRLVEDGAQRPASDQMGTPQAGVAVASASTASKPAAAAASAMAGGVARPPAKDDKDDADDEPPGPLQMLKRVSLFDLEYFLYGITKSGLRINIWNVKNTDESQKQGAKTLFNNAINKLNHGNIIRLCRITESIPFSQIVSLERGGPSEFAAQGWMTKRPERTMIPPKHAIWIPHRMADFFEDVSASPHIYIYPDDHSPLMPLAFPTPAGKAKKKAGGSGTAVSPDPATRAAPATANPMADDGPVAALQKRKAEADAASAAASADASNPKVHAGAAAPDTTKPAAGSAYSPRKKTKMADAKASASDLRISANTGAATEARGGMNVSTSGANANAGAAAPPSRVVMEDDGSDEDDKMAGLDMPGSANISAAAARHGTHDSKSDSKPSAGAAAPSSSGVIDDQASGNDRESEDDVIGEDEWDDEAGADDVEDRDDLLFVFPMNLMGFNKVHPPESCIYQIRDGQLVAYVYRSAPESNSGGNGVMRADRINELTAYYWSIGGSQAGQPATAASSSGAAAQDGHNESMGKLLAAALELKSEWRVSSTPPKLLSNETNPVFTYQGSTPSKPEQGAVKTPVTTAMDSQIRYWKYWREAPNEKTGEKKKNKPRNTQPLPPRQFNKAGLGSQILYKKNKGAWTFGATAMRSIRALGHSQSDREAAAGAMGAYFDGLGVAAELVRRTSNDKKAPGGRNRRLNISATNLTKAALLSDTELQAAWATFSKDLVSWGEKAVAKAAADAAAAAVSKPNPTAAAVAMDAGTSDKDEKVSAAATDGTMSADGKAQADARLATMARRKLRLRTDQEWCHLLGHGDGGLEEPGNFISGSKHCNTEQLAIEIGQRTARRDYDAILEARITGYLMKSMGMRLLPGADTKWSAHEQTLLRSLNWTGVPGGAQDHAMGVARAGDPKAVDLPALPAIAQVECVVNAIEDWLEGKRPPPARATKQSADNSADNSNVKPAASAAAAAIELKKLKDTALTLVASLLPAAVPAVTSKPAAAKLGNRAAAAAASRGSDTVMSGGAGPRADSNTAVPMEDDASRHPAYPSATDFKGYDETNQQRVAKDIAARLKQILIWPYPVGNFVRYKIYYCGLKANKNAGRNQPNICNPRKIFDHTFDAQREGFDLNEFNILDMTVRRVVAEAVDTHMGQESNRQGEYLTELQARVDEIERLRGYAAEAKADAGAVPAAPVPMADGVPNAGKAAGPPATPQAPPPTVGGRAPNPATGGTGPVATYPVSTGSSAAAAKGRAATGGADGGKPPAPKPPPNQTLATTLKVAARTARNRTGAAAAAADADAN